MNDFISRESAVKAITEYKVKIESESFFAGAKLLVKPGYLEIAGLPKNKNSDSSVRITNISSKDDFTEM